MALIPYNQVQDLVWTGILAELETVNPRDLDLVEVQAQGWTVVLEVHREMAYRTAWHYTRFRAPYRQEDPFRFLVRRKKWTTSIARRLGMEDVKTGDPVFDQEFILQCTDKVRTLEVLSDNTLRASLLRWPELRVHLRDTSEWYAAQLPRNGTELAVEIPHKVVDRERLQELYELFAQFMGTLTGMSGAYRNG